MAKTDKSKNNTKQSKKAEPKSKKVTPLKTASSKTSPAKVLSKSSKEKSTSSKASVVDKKMKPAKLPAKNAKVQPKTNAGQASSKDRKTVNSKKPASKTAAKNVKAPKIEAKKVSTSKKPATAKVLKKTTASKPSNIKEVTTKETKIKKDVASEVKLKEKTSSKKTEAPISSVEDAKEVAKRGRKKKTDIILSVKAKAKINKKPGKSSDPEELEGEDFPALEDDLSLGIDDDLDVDLTAPVKRRPGRPSKVKDVPTGKLIAFPTASARLPKREPTKPKKILSSTLPGSSLAQMFVTKQSPAGKTGKLSVDAVAEAPFDAAIPRMPDDPDLDISKDSLPSWTPRNWVTREGERLIIRGQELVKEEQFGNLEAETASGVISPEEVEEVIRRIRESYKKKNTSKKVT